MRRIIWSIVAIPLCILIFDLLPYILNFAAYLIRIDNVDFGFPLWLDLLIDGISGLIAYFFIRSMFSLSKRDEQTWQNVIAIIIGFIIGIIVHIFLKYWIWIVIIIGILLITSIICYIVNNKNQGERNG